MSTEKTKKIVAIGWKSAFWWLTVSIIPLDRCRGFIGRKLVL
ncbi:MULTISPECIES: hypothetical protein [Bartonella]|nr:MULTISPECIES: hypothetical protein [Bartonella]